MTFDYKSKRWEHKRKMILKRDHYQCQRCKRYGKQVEATSERRRLEME